MQMSSVPESDGKEVFKLAPFNPSSEQIQEKAFQLLQLQSDDVLFDLGCGDGRLLIAAANKHPGLRCVGVEIDPVFATRAKEALRRQPLHVQDRIDIRQQDALQIPLALSPFSSTDITTITLLDDATALYLFVLPKGIQKLMPVLDALLQTRRRQARKLRVLSYMFKIHSWEPTMVDKTSKGECPIYLYEFLPQ